MITKERLEELIEQGVTIYGVYGENISGAIPLKNTSTYEFSYYGGDRLYTREELRCGYGDYYWERSNFSLDNLYENKEDAEFVAKYHTSRPEYFKPPVKLERGESYLFVSRKYGNAEIWHNFSNNGEYMVTDERYDCGGGECSIFYTYEEAVEKARKLFLGESDD